MDCRLWLAESKDKRFGDLSESDARSYFRKFIKQYNSGELSSRSRAHRRAGSPTALNVDARLSARVRRIYDGVSFSEIDPSMRHSHKWKFAKGLDSFEQVCMQRASTPPPAPTTPARSLYPSRLSPPAAWHR